MPPLPEPPEPPPPPTTTTTTLAQWRRFRDDILTTRRSPAEFARLLATQRARHPLPSPGGGGGRTICTILLGPTADNDESPDPRWLRYVPVLLACGDIKGESGGVVDRYDTGSREEACASVVDVLAALGAVSSFKRLAAPEDGELAGLDKGDTSGKPAKITSTTATATATTTWRSSFAAEESLFYRLAKLVSMGEASRKPAERLALVRVVAKWMELVSTALHRVAAKELLDSNGDGSAAQSSSNELAEMNAVVMALGTLVVSVVESPVVLESLRSSRPVAKESVAMLSTTLSAFLPLLMPVSASIATRLQSFQTQTLLTLLAVDDNKIKTAVDSELQDLLDGGAMGVNVDNMIVTDVPVVNSRAGLYIWLNAMLAARPLIDDEAIFIYLNNRYQGDLQTTTIDLILASFDVLSTAMENRNENPETTSLLKSFLINKLPLLLLTLSHSYFPPLTSEYCITQALSQVDTNAFPTLSSMFDEQSGNNNTMSSISVRSDFSFACCLHGLVAESSIESLLGDVPMQSLPAGGRYTKDALVQKYLVEGAKLEGLVEELPNTDGNVGAVSQAIAEIMARLCTNKETMSLKTLCTQLVQHPASLDIILLFSPLTTITRPVCELLDHWRYEDDQAEYQPVYEEFGSALLFLVTVVKRYGLVASDLGIKTTDSFVAKFLTRGHLVRPASSLTPTEQGHLDGWIRGLFNPESSGLGDELMGSCEPQSFYLLIPTLFQHIVLATHTKYLPEETLRGGLEFLVDTFLLPSLVPALTWLSTHLWAARGDADAVLLVLRFLITKSPSGVTGNMEGASMLNAILTIVTSKLEPSLRFLQQCDPVRQDVGPLLRVLKERSQTGRRAAASYSELEAWTKNETGSGLVAKIRQTTRSLVQWAINPRSGIMPAMYTHRLFLVALKFLGASRVFRVLMDEIKFQSERGHDSIIYDIIVALICAPDAQSSASAAHESDVLGVTTSQSESASLQSRLALRDILQMEVNKIGKIHKDDPFYAECLVRLHRRIVVQMARPQPTATQMGLAALQTADLIQSAVEDATTLQSALDEAMSGAAVDMALAVDVGADLTSLGMDAGLGDDLMSGLMTATSASVGAADLLMDDIEF